HRRVRVGQCAQSILGIGRAHRCDGPVLALRRCGVDIPLPAAVPGGAARMNNSRFARQVRRLALAWIALLALMFASLGSAYVLLGIGNAVAGLVIASVKVAIVIALFM